MATVKSLVCLVAGHKFDVAKPNIVMRSEHSYAYLGYSGQCTRCHRVVQMVEADGIPVLEPEPFTGNHCNR